MKALVVNALGRGFDVEDVEIAPPKGREVRVEVQASGLCHTDLLFATHDIAPTPSVLGHEVAGIVAEVGLTSHKSTSAITSPGLSRRRVAGALDVCPAVRSSADIQRRRCVDRMMRRD